uniref:Uncharacterized protein n=1 Tax=Rhizophora mucronata TaxID=61149 RepID=A0A2P2NAB0_RHIMU
MLCLVIGTCLSNKKKGRFSWIFFAESSHEGPQFGGPLARAGGDVR